MSTEPAAFSAPAPNAKLRRRASSPGARLFFVRPVVVGLSACGVLSNDTTTETYSPTLMTTCSGGRGGIRTPSG